MGDLETGNNETAGEHHQVEAGEKLQLAAPAPAPAAEPEADDGAATEPEPDDRGAAAGPGDDGQGADAPDAPGDSPRRTGAHFLPPDQGGVPPGPLRAGREAISALAIRGHTAWETLAIFVLTFTLTAFWFHHAWVHPTTLQVGIPGDADEYDWFLSWVPWALAHGHNALLSGYVNSAQGVNLMWNTSVLLPSVVTAPLTAIFSAPFSYNVLITLAPALDTALAYLAFRRWCGRLPSLVGALLFGFSPYFTVQSPGHLAQVLMMSLPLMLIVGDRLLVVQKSKAWRDGLMLGLVAWAQLLTGEELLAMEGVVAVIALAVLALVNRRAVREKLAYAAKGAGVAALAFVVLAAPFLDIQYRGPYQVEGAHPGNAYVTDLLNFIVPSNITRLSPSWAVNISNHFIQGEDGAYMGIPLVLLIIFALWAARRRKVVWVAAAITLGAAVLSMGSTLHYYGHNSHIWMPGSLVQHLPSMKNLLPARFAGVADFGAALLAALGLNELARRSWAWLGAGWAMAVAALVFIFPIVNYPASLAPNYPAFSSGWACPAKPAADSTVTGSTVTGRPPVVLFMPAGDELNLLWQAESHFCFATPSARGMTGTSPITRELPPVLAVGVGGTAIPPVNSAVRQQFAEGLRAFHIQEILVAPEAPASPQGNPQNQAELVVWLEALLGGPPQAYHEMNFAYAWKHLPSYQEIYTGHFAKG